jgi:hypothetical protein
MALRIRRGLHPLSDHIGDSNPYGHNSPYDPFVPYDSHNGHDPNDPNDICAIESTVRLTRYREIILRQIDNDIDEIKHCEPLTRDFGILHISIQAAVQEAAWVMRALNQPLGVRIHFRKRIQAELDALITPHYLAKAAIRELRGDYGPLPCS